MRDIFWAECLNSRIGRAWGGGAEDGNHSQLAYSLPCVGPHDDMGQLQHVPENRKESWGHNDG
jgi:hypothetical protein